MNLVKSRLEESWKSYEEKVYEIAAYAFEYYVKPFCDENNCFLLTGNGTWYLGFDKDGQRYTFERTGIADGILLRSGALVRHILDDPALKKALDKLYLEVDVMPGNDLGSIMPQYTDRKYMQSPIEVDDV